MTVRNSAIAGRCLDISEEGMKVECIQSIPPDSHGTVTMTHPAWTLELNMRVAHANSSYVGLMFVYKSDRERTMVARFVASLDQVRSTMRLLR